MVDADAFPSEPAEADEDTAAQPPRPSPPKPTAGKPRLGGARGKPGPARRPAKAPAPEPASGSTAVKSIEEIEKARSKRGAAGEPRRSIKRGSPRRPGAMPEAPSRRSIAPSAAPEPDWRTRPAPAPVAKPAGPDPSGSSISAPEELLAETKRFVLGLPTSDKLAFIGAALTVFFAFFPWKETAVDGEVLGLMSLGFPVFAVSILSISALVTRVRRFMPKLNPLAPWIVQLACACFCILWCLVFIKLSWDSRLATSPVGNFEMYLSKPSFGVFASLLTSIVSLGGTLMGLKEK